MSYYYSIKGLFDPAKLHEELTAAGFDVETVYGDGRVQLAASEKKDPTEIIGAHDPRRKTAAELAAEAAAARASAARDHLKAIKAKGKVAWNVDDLKDGLEAALVIVGV